MTRLPAPDVAERKLYPPPPMNSDMFRGTRPLRADMAGVHGGLKLDGIARILQDAGIDHLAQNDWDKVHPHWIVRRTLIDVYSGGEKLSEKLTVTRWCSGINQRWCNARVQVLGELGTHVETEAFWINFNIDTATPSKIHDDFISGFGQTTDEKKLRWKAVLGKPDGTENEAEFPLRVTDLDTFDHVNNAVYWAALEHALRDHEDLRTSPYRAVVEHNSPLTLKSSPRLLTRRGGDRLDAFLVDGDAVAASMAVIPLVEARPAEATVG